MIDSLSYLDYRGDTYINIGKQTNHGVEITMHSRVSDKISVSGNISLVSGTLDYDPSHIDTSHTRGHHVQLFSNGAFLNTEVEGIGLIRRPNTANLSFSYKPVEKIVLGIRYKYVGARRDIYYSSALGPYGALAANEVKDYALTDFFINYNIFTSFNAAFRVENIFDVKYSEILGYTTRGRGFYLNIRYTFVK
jgi:vitamin B12 transporter